MIDDVFQRAYALVRSRHSDQAWFNLSQREITTEIYAEIRVLDRSQIPPSDANQTTSIAVAAE